MKIGFIGQGWIGKNYADYFENKGFDVVRYSLEQQYIQNKDKIKKCNIIFIAVPTPTTLNGFDISIVDKVLEEIPEQKIVVIKSTLLPGTTEGLQKKYPNLFIFHSPEFLREKHAVEDVAFPSRNIIGIPINTQEYIKKAEEILSILPKSRYNKILDSKSAEFIKYISNSFLMMKLIFFNTMYDIIDNEKINYDEIIEGVVADDRIGTSHTKIFDASGCKKEKGRGAGGHCLPKDFKAFLDLFEKKFGVNDTKYKLLKNIQDYNLELLKNSNKDIDIIKKIFEK